MDKYMKYEEYGILEPKQPKYTRKQIETIGIWTANAILLGFALLGILIK